MSLREQLYAALLEYIQSERDQLAEKVISVFENTGWSYDAEDGNGESWITMHIVYQVPREIKRNGQDTWWFNGSMDDLIYEIDSAKEARG